MKYLLEKTLQIFAKLILKKYHPKIVAITGSVGKTSTKEAVFAALKKYFNVRASPSNYNNEIGAPLAVIGAETGGHSFLKWLKIFLRAFGLIILPRKYPEMLILEMGADHPGDIEKLMKLAPPAVSVVTAVAPVHLEFFGSLKKIADEKSKIIERLPKTGAAILNYDDEAVMAMSKRAKAKVTSFGFGEGADVSAVEMAEYFEPAFIESEALGGVKFKLRHGGSVVPVVLRDVLGRQHVYAALAAAAVGLNLGLNLVQIAEGLKNYEPPKSRMKLIKGIKGTLIIDDTYNSSPRAALEALEVLKRLASKENTRSIAALGDMLELGEYTEEGHREVGRSVAKAAQALAVVGERGVFITEEAEKSGLPKRNIYRFNSAEEAGHFLQEMIQSGDVLLIKGSQGMRMERIVKELMAEPLKAPELLVRQGEEWQK